MTARPRVAVFVDDPVVPAAFARLVHRLDDAPVELLGVHVHPRATSVRRRPIAALVDRAERAAFRPSPDALAPVDLRRTRPDLFSGAPTDRPDFRGCTDVVLDLTTGGVPAASLAASPPEVWSLRYGRGRRRLSLGAYAAEYVDGASTSVCELVAEGGAGTLRVLYRSTGAVDRLSPARTLNEAAWKSAEFPSRALTSLASTGRAEAPQLAAPEPGVDERSAPAPAAVAGTVVRRGLREAVRRVSGRPTWFVAVRTGRSDRPGEPGFDTTGFGPLQSPPGRFYADPFVVRRPEGGAYVFVEDGPLGGGPARISVLALDADGVQEQPAQVVLERPTHLSYPFVFQDAGEWYLLPENAGSGAVELLRAREFPRRWESCGDLLRNVRAWDPTLLRHDGRYWLFVTTGAPGVRPSDELCLYSTAALSGPWRPHPMNPVVSDVRRARPAGRILETDGSLLRPAQDGTGAYGRRIVWNRIDVLTPEDYRETSVGAIEPGWLPGVVRTHTYTADGTFEVLDGLRHEPRLRPGWWRHLPS